jgi:hypothetical protein
LFAYYIIFFIFTSMLGMKKLYVDKIILSN